MGIAARKKPEQQKTKVNNRVCDPNFFLSSTSYPSGLHPSLTSFPTLESQPYLSTISSFQGDPATIRCPILNKGIYDISFSKTSGPESPKSITIGDKIQANEDQR